MFKEYLSKLSQDKAVSEMSFFQEDVIDSYEEVMASVGFEEFEGEFAQGEGGYKRLLGLELLIDPPDFDDIEKAIRGKFSGKDIDFDEFSFYSAYEDSLRYNLLGDYFTTEDFVGIEIKDLDIVFDDEKGADSLIGILKSGEYDSDLIPVFEDLFPDGVVDMEDAPDLYSVLKKAGLLEVLLPELAKASCTIKKFSDLKDLSEALDNAVAELNDPQYWIDYVETEDKVSDKKEDKVQASLKGVFGSGEGEEGQKSFDDFLDALLDASKVYNASYEVRIGLVGPSGKGYKVGFAFDDFVPGVLWIYSNGEVIVWDVLGSGSPLYKGMVSAGVTPEVVSALDKVLLDMELYRPNIYMFNHRFEDPCGLGQDAVALYLYGVDDESVAAVKDPFKLDNQSDANLFVEELGSIMSEADSIGVSQYYETPETIENLQAVIDGVNSLYNSIESGGVSVESYRHHNVIVQEGASGKTLSGVDPFEVAGYFTVKKPYHERLRLSSSLNVFADHELATVFNSPQGYIVTEKLPGGGYVYEVYKVDEAGAVAFRDAVKEGGGTNTSLSTVKGSSEWEAKEKELRDAYKEARRKREEFKGDESSVEYLELNKDFDEKLHKYMKFLDNKDKVSVTASGQEELSYEQPPLGTEYTPKDCALMLEERFLNVFGGMGGYTSEVLYTLQSWDAPSIVFAQAYDVTNADQFQLQFNWLTEVGPELLKGWGYSGNLYVGEYGITI